MIKSNLSIIIFIISFLFTFYFYKFFLSNFSKNLLDKPNARSSHNKNTPTGGGLGFIFITIIFCLVEIFTFGISFITMIPLISIPIIIVSFIDDFSNLPIKYRFASQILTSSILILNFLFKYENESIILLIVFFLFLLLLSIALINFINFIDGIDGLISGSFLIILLTFAFSNSLSLSFYALIGGICAFLLFNWSPAKLFMGDIGSTFLGAIYVGLIFEQKSLDNAISYLLIFTPIFADAISCIVMRFIYKQNIFKPHKLHLYQRLHQSGMSHSDISSIYIVGIILLSLTFFLGNLNLLFFVSLIEILIGFLLNRFVAVKFKKY